MLQLVVLLALTLVCVDAVKLSGSLEQALARRVHNNVGNETILFIEGEYAAIFGLLLLVRQLLIE
jgi:hypothetical protein